MTAVIAVGLQTSSCQVQLLMISSDWPLFVGWFPHLFNRPTDVLIKWENTMQKQNCCSEFRQQFALISKSYLQGWRGLTVELSSIQILSKPSMQPKQCIQRRAHSCHCRSYGPSFFQKFQPAAILARQTTVPGEMWWATFARPATQLQRESAHDPAS